MLVRDSGVREEFDRLLYCTVGSAPSLLQLQRLLFRQLAGRDPPSTQEDTVELLLAKLRGEVADYR